MKITKRQLVKLIKEQHYSSIEDKSVDFKNNLLLQIKNIDTFNLSNQELLKKGIKVSQYNDINGESGWRLVWETKDKKFETICKLIHKEIKK